MDLSNSEKIDFIFPGSNTKGTEIHCGASQRRIGQIFSWKIVQNQEILVTYVTNIGTEKVHDKENQTSSNVNLNKSIYLFI